MRTLEGFRVKGTCSMRVPTNGAPNRNTSRARRLIRGCRKNLSAKSGVGQRHGNGQAVGYLMNLVVIE